MKEQIEKMAKALDECPYIAEPIGGDKHEGSIRIAEYLVNQKGYRKQIEAEWRSELVKRCDWKGKKHDYYQPNSCSLCHEAVVKRTPFCPNCGAKMKGGAE